VDNSFLKKNSCRQMKGTIGKKKGKGEKEERE
jgi:hypothetical protein